MWVKQCHKPPMTGNGKFIPPIKMVMTGGWFIIVLPTWVGKVYEKNERFVSWKCCERKNWYKINNWLVVWNINFIFPYIGLLIIPIDFHIFQRGSNHQPYRYMRSFWSSHFFAGGFLMENIYVFSIIYTWGYNGYIDMGHILGQLCPTNLKLALSMRM